MTQVFVWTLTDVVTVAILAIVFVASSALSIRLWIKQRRCLHDGGIFETSKCDAICRKCGKNLGFIGALRK